MDLRTLSENETGYTDDLFHLSANVYGNQDWLKKENISERIRDPESDVIVAEDKEVMGTVTYRADKQIAEISHLIVDSDKRKNGVGSRLANYCKEEIDELNSDMYLASCTLEHLGSQVIFHELGMEPVAFFKNLTSVSLNSSKDSNLIMAGYNAEKQQEEITIPEDYRPLAQEVIESTGFEEFRDFNTTSGYKGNLNWYSREINSEQAIFSVMPGGIKGDIGLLRQEVAEAKRLYDYVRLQVDASVGLPKTILDEFVEFNVTGYAPLWPLSNSDFRDSLMLEEIDGDSGKIHILDENIGFLENVDYEFSLQNSEDRVSELTFS